MIISEVKVFFLRGAQLEAFVCLGSPAFIALDMSIHATI